MAQIPVIWPNYPLNGPNTRNMAQLPTLPHTTRTSTPYTPITRPTPYHPVHGHPDPPSRVIMASADPVLVVPRVSGTGLNVRIQGWPGQLGMSGLAFGH